ncbi:MAG: hypothetical protein Ta2D_01090 [Rickettsiales bacterium]|nr:MAG: hypothetical protein Ta2D_01090 [Rickettsiales bacterium]
MKKFLILYFVFIGISNAIVLSCNATSNECVEANDFGGSVSVIVEANPPLAQTGQYMPERPNSSERYKTTQKATWTDPRVVVNGQPMKLKIRGKWAWTNDDWSQDVKRLMSAGKLCSLKRSGVPEVIGFAGDMDFISSLRYVSRDSTGQVVLDFPVTAEAQDPCWMIGGEGMYIAGFGPVGTDMPGLATHLKTVDIICENEYASDKNGDGVFTLKECYDPNDSNKTNMAYYKGSYNESDGVTTSVSCPSENFLHATLAQRARIAEGKFPTDVCYYEEGGRRMDKTDFVYQTRAIFKNAAKHSIAVGDRIKFMIYDTYYTDNAGFYELDLSGGFSTMSGDGGIIKEILNDLESTFIGKVGSNGKRDGGILKEMYNRIVRDSVFSSVVRISMTLYVSIWGLSFLLGIRKNDLKDGPKEYFDLLLRMVFVVTFTSYTGWQMYNNYIVSFFFEGLGDVMAFLANMALNAYNDVEYTPVSGRNLTDVFGFIDNYIKSLFSKERTIKVWGLFFAVWYGFLFIIPIYYLLVKFVLKLLNATFPFIIQFIQVVFALILGPVVIFLYLFKFKLFESVFKKWIAFIGNRFMNMTFVFVFINMFAAIIRQRIDELTGLCACKFRIADYWMEINNDSRKAVKIIAQIFTFGAKAWIDLFPGNERPGIKEFAVGYLGIHVIILIFEKVMQKVPEIVDNMVDIGGESGGGFNPATGGSALGGAIGNDGFMGLLNRIKYDTYDENGKKETRGLGSGLAKGILGSEDGELSFKSFVTAPKRALTAIDDKIGDVAFRAFNVGDGSAGPGRLLLNKVDGILPHPFRKLGQYFKDAWNSSGQDADRAFDKYDECIARGMSAEEAHKEAMGVYRSLNDDKEAQKAFEKLMSDAEEKQAKLAAKNIENLSTSEENKKQLYSETHSGDPKFSSTGGDSLELSRQELRDKRFSDRYGLDGKSPNEAAGDMLNKLDGLKRKEELGMLSDAEKAELEHAKRFMTDFDRYGYKMDLKDPNAVAFFEMQKSLLEQDRILKAEQHKKAVDAGIELEARMHAELQKRMLEGKWSVDANGNATIELDGGGVMTGNKSALEEFAISPYSNGLGDVAMSGYANGLDDVAMSGYSNGLADVATKGYGKIGDFAMEGYTPQVASGEEIVDKITAQKEAMQEQKEMKEKIEKKMNLIAEAKEMKEKMAEENN